MLSLQVGVHIVPLAQLAEQKTFNLWVLGSSPRGDTMKSLIEALVKDDPWTHSLEGLDDTCFYCEAWTYLQHEPDCAWILGRKFLGKDLIARNQWGDEVQHGVRYEMPD